MSAEKQNHLVLVHLTCADQPFNHRHEETGRAAVLVTGRTPLTTRSGLHSPGVEIVTYLAATAYHCGGQLLTGAHVARHPAGSKEAATARELRAVIMKGHALDTLDVKILAALQSHGRLSNVELAKKVGLSAPPALRRTAVLEDRGLIKCYRAELDPKMLGFEVTAFITVTLASQTQADIAAFEAVMQPNPNIRECHALSGHKDFLLKGVFRDLTQTNDFVRDVLLRTPNVRTVSTAFTIARTKHEPTVPLEMVEAKLAPGDIKKLREIAFRRAAE